MYHGCMETEPRLRQRTLVRWFTTSSGQRKWVILARRGEPFVPYRSGPTRNPSAEYRIAIVAHLIERDGLKCPKCGLPLGPDFSGKSVHVDHIVPVIQGGGHTLANFRLLHAWCNQTQPKRDPRKPASRPPNFRHAPA